MAAVAEPLDVRISAIFRIRPDGTGLRQLTNPKRDGDDRPIWSPDGSKILFNSTRHLPPRKGELESREFGDVYVMNPDGSQQRRITFTKPVPEDVPSGGSGAGAWSLQGDAFAFTHHRNVDVIALDGSGRHTLCRASPAVLFETYSASAWR